jgi:hypothetical protein
MQDCLITDLADHLQSFDGPVRYQCFPLRCVGGQAECLGCVPKAGITAHVYVASKSIAFDILAQAQSMLM